MLFNQIVHQMQTAPAAEQSQTAIDSKADAPTEQPLDLSAKPSSSPTFLHHDSKHVYR